MGAVAEIVDLTGRTRVATGVWRSRLMGAIDWGARVVQHRVDEVQHAVEKVSGGLAQSINLHAERAAKTAHTVGKEVDRQKAIVRRTTSGIKRIWR